jgi:hypothetical protein
VRQRVDIHPLEQHLNCKAEIILESIARAADITIRGIRGIITEVAFKQEILSRYTTKWKDVSTVGEHPYDFFLEEVTDAKRHVNIQVKMQRKERGVVKINKAGKWVVEVQKTRNGKDKDGEDTRPYRFGEFDILAVSLQPATGDWDKFLYTVGTWLIPRKEDAALIQVLQPVATRPNEDWTDNLETAIEWYFSGKKKTIAA